MIIIMIMIIITTFRQQVARCVRGRRLTSRAAECGRRSESSGRSSPSSTTACPSSASSSANSRPARVTATARQGRRRRRDENWPDSVPPRLTPSRSNRLRTPWKLRHSRCFSFLTSLKLRNWRPCVSISSNFDAANWCSYQTKKMDQQDNIKLSNLSNSEANSWNWRTFEHLNFD